MTRQPEVTRLTQRQWTAAADCLARAFAHDPLWSAMFPDEADRQRQLRGMFRATVRKAVYGGLPLTTPRVSAVAIWQPPRRRMVTSMVRSGFAEERWLLGLPAPDRRRLTAVYERLQERRHALMPSAYWYLEAIGVDPDYQGRGLGGALIRDGLTRADEAELPAYLETEAEALVSMYSHFGFRVMQEVQAPELGVPIWLMRREAVQHPQIRYEQM